jgi:hypothetical protein
MGKNAVKKAMVTLDQRLSIPSQIRISGATAILGIEPRTTRDG